MSVKSKAVVPTDELELYEKVVATNPEIERKGARHPYTSLNGNMFSYLHPSGSMALRLPKDEPKKFLAKYKTTVFEIYGVVQKEYVTVPGALLKKTNQLQKILRAELAIRLDLEGEAL